MWGPWTVRDGQCKRAWDTFLRPRLPETQWLSVVCRSMNKETSFCHCSWNRASTKYKRYGEKRSGEYLFIIVLRFTSPQKKPWIISRTLGTHRTCNVSPTSLHAAHPWQFQGHSKIAMWSEMFLITTGDSEKWPTKMRVTKKSTFSYFTPTL